MSRISLVALYLLLQAGVANAETPRIVTLGAAATETAFALGAGDLVVAVDDSSLWPPAAQALPKVGYYRSLNAEGVLSLRPDRIVGTDQVGPPPVVHQLRGAGVAMDLLPTPRSEQQLLNLFAALGEQLGASPDQVVELQQSVQQQIQQARAHSGERSPRVLVLMGGAHGLLAAGKDTAAALMLELVGARNAVDFAHYKPASAEALLGLAPEAIVIATRGPQDAQSLERLRQHPALAQSPAVATNRLLVMDAGLLLGLGPRTGEAAMQLAQQLNP